MSIKRLSQVFLALGITSMIFTAGLVMGYRYPGALGLDSTTRTTSPSTSSRSLGLDALLPKDTVNEQDFDLFWRVWNLAKEKHVDRPGDDDQLIYGAINGMLQLGYDDQFSAFLEPEINTMASEDLSGSFGGVGVELEIKNGYLTIVAPIPDTPGDKAGLLAGDMITAIDGEDNSTWTIIESVSKMRGQINTTVRLSILRILDDGEIKEFDVDIKRALIDVESVKWELLEGDIAYMKIRNFAADTNAEWDRVVTEIVAAQPKALILDLRNNAGGYITAAVHMVSEFVSGGKVITQDFGQGDKRIMRVTGEGRLFDIPMVILINRGTASSSEMVTGALQDYERATVIGVNSYGKGVIQEIFSIDLGDKGEASVRIVTARWYTPNDRWVQDDGLEPDIEVKTTMEQYEQGIDPVMERAIEELQGI